MHTPILCSCCKWLKIQKMAAFFLLLAHFFNFCFFEATSEVSISSAIKHEFNELSIIHATYSLGPHQYFIWYHKGIPLEPGHSHISMDTDGLNAVLKINTESNDVLGKYTIRIEGTSIRDTINFIPSKTIWGQSFDAVI